MTVSGIELKEGQKWRTQTYGIVTIVKPGLNEKYPWKFIEDGQEEGLFITDDGKAWTDDAFPILLELIKDVPMKFNPQPGDKIICNNGEEFICCTLEFLRADGIRLEGENIFGYQTVENNTYTKYEWQYWDKNGEVYYEEWKIREVIPQGAEAPADKKEEAKEELRYTMAKFLKQFNL